MVLGLGLSGSLPRAFFVADGAIFDMHVLEGGGSQGSTAEVGVEAPMLMWSGHCLLLSGRLVEGGWISGALSGHLVGQTGVVAEMPMHLHARGSGRGSGCPKTSVGNGSRWLGGVESHLVFLLGS